MSHERREIIGFVVDNSNTVPSVKLFLGNYFNETGPLPIEGWFPLNHGLKVNLLYDRIEMEFPQKDCMRLVDALEILKQHGLGLTDVAIKKMYTEFLKVMEQADNLRHEKNISDHSIEPYLNAYQACFYGLHEYFKTLEKYRLRKIIGEISIQEEVETPISKRVYDLFNHADFLKDKNIHPANFLVEISDHGISQFLHQKVQGQWTAFNSNYIDTDVLGLQFSIYLRYNLHDENKSFQLDTTSLNIATAEALQNLIAYAVQLGVEKARKDDRDDDLETKIKLTSDFITEIFQQKDLTQDALFDAYERLEREDKNRGTGFYRVHSFFTRKHYLDEDGRKRLVKSTLGELAYDLMQTLDNVSQSQCLTPLALQ